MPRRTRPVKRLASTTIGAADHTVLYAKARAIVCRDSRLARLPADKKDRLIRAVADAVVFARIGLADLLAGKNTRSAAWTADILVKDICDALEAAGVPAMMNPDRDESLAQWLADEVAAVAGLPNQGKLFKQMQRARRIVKTELPPSGKPTLVLGRWQVLK